MEHTVGQGIDVSMQPPPVSTQVKRESKLNV